MDKNKREKTIGKKILKVLLIILVIFVLFIVCAIGAGTIYLNNKLSKIQTVDINEEDIEITEGVKEELAGYRNIALLGIDSREDTYSKGNRSDCIIIASINNQTKEVRLVSVYRDTYLELTGRDLDKVTHAYSFGGPTLALSTLNTNLDLDMTEFVTVNFDAVKDTVDALGGVKINITSEEVSHVPNISSAGTYNLNGEQALAYSRIRHAAGGDYVRTERMRNVIEACLEKLKTKSLTQMNSLSDEILPKIYTNIGKNEIISLLPDIAKYSIVKSEGWPESTQGDTINGIWYGVPRTLESNVRILHKELFDNANYEPSDTVKRISNKIVTRTGYTEK